MSFSDAACSAFRISAAVGVTLALSFTSGCTSKQLYNAVQENRLQECAKLYGSQREECEARYQMDYETYERERQQVLNEDSSKRQ